MFTGLASLITTNAVLRPLDGLSHPLQEHMKDTFSLRCEEAHKHFSVSGVLNLLRFQSCN